MNFFIALTSLSVLAAIAAALFWLASALVKTPSSFSIHVARADGMMGTPLGGNPLGGTYIGQAYSEDLIALANALRRQSRLSAYAAACAAVSALAQGLALVVGT
jgi:hypothetical protein